MKTKISTEEELVEHCRRKLPQKWLRRNLEAVIKEVGWVAPNHPYHSTAVAPLRVLTLLKNWEKQGVVSRLNRSAHYWQFVTVEPRRQPTIEYLCAKIMELEQRVEQLERGASSE